MPARLFKGCSTVNLNHGKPFVELSNGWFIFPSIGVGDRPTGDIDIYVGNSITNPQAGIPAHTLTKSAWGYIPSATGFFPALRSLSKGDIAELKTLSKNVYYSTR